MRQKIEVRSEPAEGCVNCAACCQDIRLTLTEAEAQRLMANGTELSPLLPPQGADFDWSTQTDHILDMAEKEDDPAIKEVYYILSQASEGMRPGEGYYGMVGRCGNLSKDNKCINYDTRPSICRDFVEGSLACGALRQKLRLKST